MSSMNPDCPQSAEELRAEALANCSAPPAPWRVACQLCGGGACCHPDCNRAAIAAAEGEPEPDMVIQALDDDWEGEQ